MAEDISESLLSDIEHSFRGHLATSSRATGILNGIDNGLNATYRRAGDYAEEVGKALSKAFKDVLSSDVLPDGKMYWNIAEKVIEPMFEEEYGLTIDAVAKVQQSLNKKANIGLKAQKAALNREGIEAIMNKVCAYDTYDEAAWLLEEVAPESFARSVVDQTLKANVSFQGKSGRGARITRTASAKCCKWCQDLEGVYDYPNVPDDVYKRHDRCRCTVDYSPGGENSQVQDVWDKQWRTPEEAAKREERKTYNLPRTYVGGKKVK